MVGCLGCNSGKQVGPLEITQPNPTYSDSTEPQMMAIDDRTRHCFNHNWIPDNDQQWCSTRAASIANRVIVYHPEIIGGQRQDPRIDICASAQLTPGVIYQGGMHGPNGQVSCITEEEYIAGGRP